MRKLIFVGFIALGALIGLISASNSDWGTRLVMKMCIRDSSKAVPRENNQ